MEDGLFPFGKAMREIFEDVTVLKRYATSAYLWTFYGLFIPGLFVYIAYYITKMA